MKNKRIEMSFSQHPKTLNRIKKSMLLGFRKTSKDFKPESNMLR